MYLAEALNFIIDDGIESVRESFKDPKDSLKLRGSIRGFGDCRGLGLSDLSDFLKAAPQTTYLHRQHVDYVFWRYRELQIEWVCNVLSAILMANGRPTLRHPTLRGMLKAVEIIGISETNHQGSANG